VSRGFIPTAGLVKVGNAICAKDAQGRPILGRNIDSPLGSSGSSEEYALLQNKLAVVRFDTSELLGHRCGTSPENSILARRQLVVPGLERGGCPNLHRLVKTGD
jgi:hypothetical protein